MGVKNLVAFMVAALLLAMVPGPSTVVMSRQILHASRRTRLAATIGDKVGLLINISQKCEMNREAC